jgi:hypothetical protein
VRILFLCDGSIDAGRRKRPTFDLNDTQQCDYDFSTKHEGASYVNKKPRHISTQDV